jgi:hypothetical protein
MVYLYLSLELYLPLAKRSTSEPFSIIYLIFLHVTKMEVLLQFITLPLAVLALVTLISFSYRRAKDLHFSPATRQFLINVHALATEGCQLALVVIAVTDTAFCIETYIDYVGRRVVPATKAAILLEMFVLSSLIFHYGAICSVDFIEGRVLLGATGVAYQWQPFVVTRSLISSMVQKSRNGRLFRHNASRKTDAHRALTDHVIQKVLTRTHPRKLDYLDLAIPEPVRRAAATNHQPLTLKGDNSSGSDRSVQQPGKHLTEDLLTPPDSNQLKDTKKVKWAPTISILSPTGVERRMSLP